MSYLKENEDIVYATCAEEKKKKKRNEINRSKYRTERNKSEQGNQLVCAVQPPQNQLNYTERFVPRLVESFII